MEKQALIVWCRKKQPLYKADIISGHREERGSLAQSGKCREMPEGELGLEEAEVKQKNVSEAL